MTTKWKVLIGLSLVLNLFLFAAICGAAYVIHRHMHDFRHGPGGLAAIWADTRGLPPESHAHIAAVVKAAALTGEPDLAKARDIRNQAAALAATQPYDAAKVTALSDEARGYENEARAKVENSLIQGMSALTPTERQIVANHILRASFRFRYFTMKPGQGPDGNPAGPPPPGGQDAGPPPPQGGQ